MTEAIQHPMYQSIAKALQWARDTEAAGNSKWNMVADTVLEKLQDALPSGSGIDSGTKIHGGNAAGFTLIVDFHHMNESGMYDGWTQHMIQVKGCLVNEFTLKISGKNRNDIKDHLAEVYDCALREIVDYGVLVKDAAA